MEAPALGADGVTPDVASEIVARDARVDELAQSPAFIRRAAAALLDAARAVDPAEPLRSTFLRAQAFAGGPVDPGPLLGFWSQRVAGNPRSARRYRWELDHRVGVAMPPYAPSVRGWRAWRKGEAGALERDPFEVEARLLLPVILGENLELLAGVAAGPGELAALAQALLDEAAPIARRDVARYVAMNDAWEDTFALWCITRSPCTLALLHPLAVAIAVSYASGRRGAVTGARFPYYQRPLVSASAQLAAALLALGSSLELAAELTHFVGAAGRDGAWSDDDDGADPLTTLVAADLLARTDPSFDPAPTLAAFAAAQGEDGLWRALGPDAPWLTAEIIALALATTRPFADRFRWPHRAGSVIDQKTGLPFYAYFIDVAHLLAHLPGLAGARISLAFIDLIGFRAFNNRHGQDAGDDVLRHFGALLTTVPCARAIRDGGDEFLVVGAPARAPLADDLRAFMTAWLDRFRAVFGDATPVVPRIVVGACAGRDLRARRQQLGREITALKELAHVPEAGVLVESGGAA